MNIRVLLVGAMLCGALTQAAEFTGYLADAKCARGGKAASPQHEECAQKCVEGGEPVVLVTNDKKVYKIKNQDKVNSHAGIKVAVEAKLEGEDTLVVEEFRIVD